MFYFEEKKGLTVFNRFDSIGKNKGLFGFCLFLALGCTKTKSPEKKEEKITAVQTRPSEGDPGQNGLLAANNNGLNPTETGTPNVTGSPSVTGTPGVDPALFNNPSAFGPGVFQTQGPGVMQTQVPGTMGFVPPPMGGQWFGLCVHQHNSPTCDVLSQFVSPQKQCPQGFVYAPFTARYNVNDQNGLNEVWAGTCLFQGQMAPQMVQSPGLYATAGSLYGMCIHHHASPTCNVGTVWPMAANKTCPPGFAFVSVSARYQGQDDTWVGACTPVGNPHLPISPYSYSLNGVCAYDYRDSHGCSRGAFGLGQMGRMMCPSGFRGYPLTARLNGLNETWASTCMRL